MPSPALSKGLVFKESMTEMNQKGEGRHWKEKGRRRRKKPLAANVIATPLASVPPSWHLFSIYTISFLFL